MGVGGSLELPHRLAGPLPAGEYHLRAHGYQPTQDGVLLGEVLYRAGPDAGTGGTLIVSATGTPPPPDAGSDVYLDMIVRGATVAAACGDTLVFRVTLTSGTSDFFEVFLDLDVP